MKCPYTINEDNRRILYDWGNGVYKSLKTVYVLEEIAIGDHYHEKKDEAFFLAAGKFKEITLGEETQYNIPAPYIINVPRGLYHKFICEKGSILFGGATEPFDINDEIKL